MVTRPKVITLCGSSRFQKEHEEAQARLTLEGCIVIPMGLYGHLVGIDMDGEIKKRLDQLHFRKIDISDEIFVVNVVTVICHKCRKPCEDYMGSSGACWSRCCNAQAFGVPYIGESTKNEILYAFRHNKVVRFLNPVEDEWLKSSP